MSWIKDWLDELQESFYRKFKCPECGEYELHIECDNYAECKKGCSYTTNNKEEIENIIASKDYDPSDKFEDYELRF